jgi:hypothetical protein
VPVFHRTRCIWRPQSVDPDVNGDHSEAPGVNLPDVDLFQFAGHTVGDVLIFFGMPFHLQDDRLSASKVTR